MAFLTYKKYYEKERVEEITQLLHNNGIEFEISEDRESLDSLYGGTHFNKEFSIKIKEADFPKANNILANESEKGLATVDSNHYLFGFTDEELFDIVTKPDEWSEFDFQLARKILKEKGKEITPETVELLKKQRLSELSKPEVSQKNWVYGGYIFALLGGVIGAFIGWNLFSSKKTLPNGHQVYSFNQEDRKHGKIIFTIAIIITIISLAIRFSE